MKKVVLISLLVLLFINGCSNELSEEDFNAQLEEEGWIRMSFVVENKNPFDVNLEITLEGDDSIFEGSEWSTTSWVTIPAFSSTIETQGYDYRYVEKIKIKITIQPKFTVQNLVAAGSIGLDLNLNALAVQLTNTEYEPEQFPGLVYKLPGTRATFLLFSNGKIVCTGTRSESKLHEAVDLLIKELAKIGYK